MNIEDLLFVIEVGLCNLTCATQVSKNKNNSVLKIMIEKIRNNTAK